MERSRSDAGGEAVDPSAITGLATGYWASMALLAANRLGIFAALGTDSRTADEVANSCGCDPRATAMLLNALVGLGLVERRSNGYRNGAASAAYLVPGRPAFLGDALKYAEDLYSSWGRLSGAVRTGAPPTPPEEILGADPEKTRNFVLAMHNRALGVARALATELRLDGRRRLLDVGGGPGTYSILLVGQTPGLRAVVLDLPQVVAIAREIIAGSGCADRIETVGGDYRTADFGRGHDVVLMSGMLHRETPQTCRELLAKAFAALEPGGLLVTSDVFFDSEAKDSPPFATLFALNMFLTSEHGSAHARGEVAAWMQAAGFVDLAESPLPPPMPHWTLRGVKPAA